MWTFASCISQAWCGCNNLYRTNLFEGVADSVVASHCVQQSPANPRYYVATFRGSAALELLAGPGW